MVLQHHVHGPSGLEVVPSKERMLDIWWVRALRFWQARTLEFWRELTECTLKIQQELILGYVLMHVTIVQAQ